MVLLFAVMALENGAIELRVEFVSVWCSVYLAMQKLLSF